MTSPCPDPRPLAVKIPFWALTTCASTAFVASPATSTWAGIQSVIFNYADRGTVIYAGPAPGMIAGVLQINVRVLDVECNVPNCFPDYGAIPVVIAIGPADPTNLNSFGKYVTSGLATIAIRQ